MVGTLRVNEALGRLKAIFCATADAELMDSEIAELVGLDEDECRILLRVLRRPARLNSTGAAFSFAVPRVGRLPTKSAPNRTPFQLIRFSTVTSLVCCHLMGIRAPYRRTGAW